MFSLFGRKHHQHIVTEQDVTNELFVLLSDAREVYLYDVIAKGKLYCRYVDDFINSHQYIDCDKVACKNCHATNLHIVRTLLVDYAEYIRHIFKADKFLLEDCVKLKKLYDTSEFQSLGREIGIGSPLSFGCSFTKKQMAGITDCVNTYHLFYVPMVSIEDMEVLFACKKGFRIRVNNIRYVAVLFDALLEKSFIHAHWQSILFRGGFLLSKNGKRTVSASSLSTALSAAKNHPTSVFYAIRTMINRLER